MNTDKYNGLKEQLKAEGENLLKEFNEKAKSGDLVRLNKELGVLVKDSLYADYFVFCPITIGGVNSGYEPYNTDIYTAELASQVEFVGLGGFRDAVQEYIKSPNLRLL